MLKLGYDKKLSTGAIMAGGALGFLIPPSVLMILYAFLAKVSVGKLFAAGMIPGLMLAGIYMVYIFVRAVLNPKVAPSVPVEDRQNAIEKIKSLRALILPGSLVTLVLWCIISGKTTPSEAAAIGAAGSVLCAVIYRTLTFDVLKNVVFETAKLMGMIIWITLAAVFFSKVYMLLDGAVIIEELIDESGFSPIWIIVMMLVCYFILGMFLDDFAIVFITVPIFVPIVELLGYDPIWFAVLFVVSMQTAYLTPPFGYNLFYMRSVAPPEITINDLYKAVIPFIILQIMALSLMVIYPDIIMWLPNKLNFG
ncbi:MAG: TRAP transporter large permease subunit, partial [Gammaproteobacteria bacterium]|nr:TRAP transporter large permease subunit [Gammaproteobacteria bacterium]